MKIVIELTPLEAVGLFHLADEGSVGLFADQAAAQAFIGDGRAQHAANRGLGKLASAALEARKHLTGKRFISLRGSDGSTKR